MTETKCPRCGDKDFIATHDQITYLPNKRVCLNPDCDYEEEIKEEDSNETRTIKK